MIYINKPTYEASEVEPLYRKCKEVCKIQTAGFLLPILALASLIFVTTSSALGDILILEIIALVALVSMVILTVIVFRKLCSKYEKFCDQSKVRNETDSLTTYMKNLLSDYKVAEEICALPEAILKEAKLYRTPNGFEINGKEYYIKKDTMEKIVYVKDGNETHLLFTELDAMFNDMLPYVAEKIEFKKTEEKKESRKYERIDFK